MSAQRDAVPLVPRDTCGVSAFKSAAVLSPGPAAIVPIMAFTKSHPCNLLSMAKSNKARSRMRFSRSRKKQGVRICYVFRPRLAPTCLPMLQAGRPLAAGSHRESPMVVLLWPNLALGREGAASVRAAFGQSIDKAAAPDTQVRRQLPTLLQPFSYLVRK